MRKIATLPDKRKLSYIEIGDEKGKVVLYFHGVPGAADECLAWDEDIIKTLGVRLIALDRPGAGHSSFYPNRRISDWAKDITDFTNILGIEKFSVLGCSGGGPYAAACAALIPDKVRTAGIISSLVSFDKEDLLEGINPQNIQFLKLSIDKPQLSKFIYSLMGLMARLSPKQYYKKALEAFGPADAKTFGIPKVHKAILSALGSAKGKQLDTKLIVSPWDFDLKEIKIPVFIWHGGQDHNASPAMGRYLEENIINSTMNYYPEEGHISLIVNHAEDIIKKLVE